MSSQPSPIPPSYPGGPQKYCYDNPSNPTCAASVPGTYHYDPSPAANIFFAALFAACLLSLALIWSLAALRSRRHGSTATGTGTAAYNIALALGLACEILGYAGRLMGVRNRWDANGFLMQICCLTVGPAFMAAAVYLCLRRVVAVFGAERSRIPAKWYTRIFIPCDVVSLILQAGGGAIASIASDSQRNSSPSSPPPAITLDQGTNIMVAGLAFQVATVTGFILAAADFALRCYRHHRTSGTLSSPSSSPADEEELIAMRSSRRFHAFLASLALAALCILVRSAFRVAELSRGWDGPVMAREDLFIAFEGVLIAVAVLALVLVHPAFCCPALFAPAKNGGKSAASAKSFREIDTSYSSISQNEAA